MGRGCPLNKQKHVAILDGEEDPTAQARWLKSDDRPTSPFTDDAFSTVVFDEDGGYFNGATVFGSLEETAPRSEMRCKVYSASVSFDTS
jgi:hypothetical protein